MSGAVTIPPELSPRQYVIFLLHVAAQIEHALDAYLEYALSRPQIFDYLFGKPREDARRFPDDFRARRSPTLNPLADMVAKQMEAGLLKEDDLWEVTLELWAHAHGYH